MTEPSSPSGVFNRHFTQLRQHPFWEKSNWKWRIALWAGALFVALAAIVFAKASVLAYALFLQMLHYSKWLPLILTPVVFALLAWVTEGRFSVVRGSGIPQVIAALRIKNHEFQNKTLLLPAAIGKMLLTLIGLTVGASIGREGPTVYVGAGVFYWMGKRFGFTDPKLASRFILAGGAAGIAAAFNTPLAGVMFAIEELADAFEYRLSGLLLTAVIIGGVVSLGIMGNYAYFGKVQASLMLNQAWLAVLATGVVCGLAGGLFARLIILNQNGLSTYIVRCRAQAPILFAAGCGLALALLGIFSDNSVYGTGYDQARAIVQNTAQMPNESFGLLKMLANIVSYWSNIPGGIFSPSLAVGAGLGHNIAYFLPQVPPSAVVLLGMSAYLSGVTGAPLTSTVIAIELTDNQDMVIPIMAACLIGRIAASLFCPVPVYKAFANRIIKDFEQPKLGS